MKTKFLIFAFIVGFQAQMVLANQLLVVSDIDDTIKESHVLSTFEKIGNAFETDEPFMGMSLLYRLIRRSNLNTQFHYVSNAPNFIMEDSHAEFLQYNSFPVNGMHLSENLDSSGHKVRVISSLIDTIKPQTVILIGDNGEQDVAVQDEIVRKYAKGGIRFVQFIRVAYRKIDGGKLLMPGQTGFITAGEIGLVLYRQGLLTLAEALSTVQSSVTTKGRLKMPEWLNCRDLQLDMSQYFEISSQIQYLEQRIKKRCHLQ